MLTNKDPIGNTSYIAIGNLEMGFNDLCFSTGFLSQAETSLRMNNKAKNFAVYLDFRKQSDTTYN